MILQRNLRRHLAVWLYICLSVINLNTWKLGKKTPITVSFQSQCKVPAFRISYALRQVAPSIWTDPEFKHSAQKNLQESFLELAGPRCVCVLALRTTSWSDFPRDWGQGQGRGLTGLVYQKDTLGVSGTQAPFWSICLCLSVCLSKPVCLSVSPSMLPLNQRFLAILLSIPLNILKSSQQGLPHTRICVD